MIVDYAKSQDCRPDPPHGSRSPSPLQLQLEHAKGCSQYADEELARNEIVSTT